MPDMDTTRGARGRLTLFGGVAALLIAATGCGGGADAADQEARAAAGAAVTANLLENEPQEARPSGDPIDVSNLGHDMGVREAPVQIIEFSDYGCGYCRKFHQETFPGLRADYIEVNTITGESLGRSPRSIASPWSTLVAAPSTSIAPC